MSWAVVARKDFEDAVRSKAFWAVSALFVLFAGAAAYLYTGTDLFGAQELSTLGLVGFLRGASGTLVPVIALLVGYRSIAGERQSGSLKLLLSLPHSRRDVVVGKLLGRTGVVAAAIGVGYLVALGVGVATIGSFAVVDFLTFTGLTVLLGLSFVGIAMGLSSATGSTSIAGALAIGFWLVFQFLWGIITLVLVWASNGFSLQGLSGLPDWATLFNQLAPGSAYTSATGILVDGPTGGGGGVVAPGGGGADVFYTEPWFGIVVLAAWVVVPVALGYLQFRRADL